MRQRAWPIVILAALAAACLVSTKEHTLYLDPDGAVEWVVLEKDVRSAEDSSDKRAAEEEDFLEALRGGEYPVARALTALHPLLVESHLLRDTRPYAVRTRAEFASIDVLLTDFLGSLGVLSDSRIEREAGLRRLTVRLSLTDEARVTREAAEDEPETAVLLQDAWRIVLTRGTFVDVSGFRRVDGDEAELGDAVELPWSTIEELADEHGDVTLSLAWKTD